VGKGVCRHPDAPCKNIPVVFLDVCPFEARERRWSVIYLKRVGTMDVKDMRYTSHSTLPLAARNWALRKGRYVHAYVWDARQNVRVSEELVRRLAGPWLAGGD
jgi:hypothetical protein